MGEGGSEHSIRSLPAPSDPLSPPGRGGHGIPFSGFSRDKVEIFQKELY